MDGVCKKQMSYFNSFKDDMSFAESILYLSLTPILYFTVLILLEEKFFKKFFNNKTRKLKAEQETMDDQVKKEKLTVALEINKINSQSKIILPMFYINSILI